MRKRKKCGWQSLHFQYTLRASRYKTIQGCPTRTGLCRGNPLKGQQGNALRYTPFGRHILAATRVYLQALPRVKYMGLLGGSGSQLWKVPHISPSMGVTEASLICSRQRCLKFKRWGNLHGNLHCNPLSPCHPEKALPKVEGKQLECVQPAWHTVISPLFLPDRRGGDRGYGFYCGGWHSLTLFSGEVGRKIG